MAIGYVTWQSTLAKAQRSGIYFIPTYHSMHAYRKLFIGLVASTFIKAGAFAQSDWPKEIPLETGGKVILYQLQPENITDNRLTARAALSVREKAGDEPIFGAIWLKATLNTDKDERLATLESIQVTDAKFPVTEDQPRGSAFLPLYGPSR